MFQIVAIFVDRKFVYVGDAPLRVPQNGGVHVIIGGTHRGASPTKDCQHVSIPSFRT